ncbi:MAG: hypothetical protein MZV70_09010 [Desulfobacterales bacterium]|nr:hypothetical protein [Desulfobacterales bacterium]
MPPWVLLGAVAVLLPIFAFMTVQNIHREKEFTTRLLVEKGAALIRSFEAGTRTGMMGMQRGGFQLQRLLTETAQLPDIAHLIVDRRRRQRSSPTATSTGWAPRMGRGWTSRRLPVQEARLADGAGRRRRAGCSRCSGSSSRPARPWA